jgi:hypothetical protein
MDLTLLCVFVAIQLVVVITICVFTVLCYIELATINGKRVPRKRKKEYI